MRMGKNKRLVYEYLLSLSDNCTRTVEVSELTILNKLGIKNQVYVHKAIHSLVEDGLIEIVRKGNFSFDYKYQKCNIYKVHSEFEKEEKMKVDPYNYLKCELEECIEYTNNSKLPDNVKKHLINWLVVITQDKLPLLKLDEYKELVNKTIKFFNKDWDIIDERIVLSCQRAFPVFIYSTDRKKTESREVEI